MTGTSACVSIKAAGQTSTTLDLQSLLKTSYKRKGLFLLGINAKYASSKQAQKGGGIPQMLEAMCVREFEAEVKILHHATTIQEKYQAVVHCGGISQAAQAQDIINIGEQSKTAFTMGGEGGPSQS